MMGGCLEGRNVPNFFLFVTQLLCFSEKDNFSFVPIIYKEGTLCFIIANSTQNSHVVIMSCTINKIFRVIFIHMRSVR